MVNSLFCPFRAKDAAHIRLSDTGGGFKVREKARVQALSIAGLIISTRQIVGEPEISTGMHYFIYSAEYSCFHNSPWVIWIVMLLDVTLHDLLIQKDPGGINLPEKVDSLLIRLWKYFCTRNV